MALQDATAAHTVAEGNQGFDYTTLAVGAIDAAITLKENSGIFNVVVEFGTEKIEEVVNIKQSDDSLIPLSIVVGEVRAKGYEVSPVLFYGKVKLYIGF